MEKTIEIPEGYEARIEGNKVILEPKESEDERIRKSIESIIRVYGKTQGEWIAGYDMDTLVVHLRDAFACLERQKEQKPLPPANSGARYYFDEWIKQQPTPKYWDAFLAGIDFNKKEQGPMHFLGIPAGDIAPAEEDGPFDEDEFLDGELSAFLQNYDKEYDDDAAVSDVARHFYEIGKKQKEQKPESCDCSRDEESYTNGIHHVLMNPEAYGLIKQKPASISYNHENDSKPEEWSEEDDALLKEIVSFFKDGTVKLQHDLDLYAGFLEKKFKSLRPQPHWKPSKEQMDHLAYAYTQLKLQKCYAPHVYETLGSLYDDLKKHFSL